jgi:myo-inositol-1(or 4)-monophosphatase
VGRGSARRTINYATGSPLCGVMLGLLEDGVPTLGVIDLPFLGVRVDSGAVADVGALEDASSAWVTPSIGWRAHGRLSELTATVHRRALRFRCVGAASVLWAWLVNGQIQGMLWPTTTRTTSSPGMRLPARQERSAPTMQALR